MKDFDEVIVVFDTYRYGSLKNKTRQNRRKGNDPVQYQVRDETRIPLNRFLSCDKKKTNADLTDYLAEKTLETKIHRS